MKNFLWIALLPLISLISARASARPEIIIPETVEVSQRQLLRLGDIAIVKEGNSELLSYLDSIILREDARSLVLEEKLNASEVLVKYREALKSQEGLRKLNVAFKVPTQIKVEFSKLPISRPEVERKILNTLSARCATCEYKISIQSTPTPNSPHWELDLSQLSAKGGFLIPVKDGDTRQIRWISGTIRTSQLTPVTNRLILQGERVLPEDVRMAMTDVTFAKDSALRMEDIQGQTAARSLPVGTAVWGADLKKEPAAKRGQVVKAVLGDSEFEITTNMQAEENGFIGDMIRVKNLETQKMLSGLIVEKGVVKLQ